MEGKFCEVEHPLYGGLRSWLQKATAKIARMEDGTVLGIVYGFPRSLEEGTPWIEPRAAHEP